MEAVVAGVDQGVMVFRVDVDNASLIILEPLKEFYLNKILVLFGLLLAGDLQPCVLLLLGLFFRTQLVLINL